MWHAQQMRHAPACATHVMARPHLCQMRHATACMCNTRDGVPPTGAQACLLSCRRCPLCRAAVGALTRGRLSTDAKLCTLIELLRGTKGSEHDGRGSSPRLAVAARRLLGCDACGHVPQLREEALRTLPSGGSLCASCVPRLLSDETCSELRRLVRVPAMRKVALGMRSLLEMNVCLHQCTAIVAEAEAADAAASSEQEHARLAVEGRLTPHFPLASGGGAVVAREEKEQVAQGPGLPMLTDSAEAGLVKALQMALRKVNEAKGAQVRGKETPGHRTAHPVMADDVRGSSPPLCPVLKLATILRLRPIIAVGHCAPPIMPFV